MSDQLLNCYTRKDGTTVFINWPTKCELMTMYCHVLPDCVGVPGINRIWPLKQRVVRDLYYKLRDTGLFSELWIFGSSTQMKCNIYSDLDIAYRLKNNITEDVSALFYGCDPNGYDLINIDNVPNGSTILHQIRKGVRLI